MKLMPAQLEAHLAKNLLPVYIVSGEELLLKNDALHLIRTAAKRAGFSERIRITAASGFDWEAFHSELYATSFLAEKRLFEIDFRQSAPVKAATQILQAFGDHCPPDTALLLDLNKIDDKITKSAWYKSLDAIGAVLTYWPITREQLPQWIMQRVTRYKMQIDKAAASLLADYVEGNLIAAAQTIEKLYLLRPQQTIDTKLVELILTDESHFTVFDFIETLLLGDKTKTLQILDNLNADGTDPVLVIWAVTRELRMLSEMAQQLTKGESYDALFKKHRIFFKRQTAVRRFLSNRTATDCWQYLTHAAGIDQIIKGAAPGDAWDALQVFCLRFA